MTLDELDYIRTLFKNAPFETIPALWFQFGDQLLDTVESHVRQQRVNRDTDAPTLSGDE